MPPPPPPSLPTLQVAGVSVRIDAKAILTDIHFAIASGQVCALIGENGAGKTTLLRSILGVQSMQSGTIQILGQPAARQLHRLGYVPQKISFDPDLPLRTRDLVDLGIPRPFWRWRPPDPHAVAEAIHAVDGEGFANQRVGRLSGGQQQRAVIAHALARKPKLLLLDEPLANLDFASANHLVQLLGRLAKEQGISIVVTAHDMNPLLPILDQLVYLVGGRAATGSVAEVVRTEVLTKLYGYPVEVLQHHGRLLVLPENPRQGLEIPCYAHDHD